VRCCYTRLPDFEANARDQMTDTKRAAITTLGCKLNQYESEQIREQLLRLGYEIVDFDDTADLYVVNSCTVTGRTDRDCRRLARKAKRQNPLSVVVMAGCYAQVSPEELGEIPEIDLILGNDQKVRLQEFLGAAAEPGHSCDLPAYAAGTMVDEFAEHTRAFVKVQEGCDAACTYCVIPRARGRAHSVPADDVLEQCRRLGAAGHPEIVLIGTHLGRYGNDLPGGPDLTGLCRTICAEASVRRLRLSSIEPREVTDELVALVAAGGRSLNAAGKLCRHLHIPLQSGCDTVLKRMNRPYDTRFYARLVGRIHEAQPLTCIGADVMVGFPGETEAEFEQTLQFVADLPLSYLHVFTYSRRPGTPAAAMPHQVDYEVKIARNHALRDLSERKRADFAAMMAGETLEVVIQERPASAEADAVTGVSDNYLQVRVLGNAPAARRLVAVRIARAVDGGLEGEEQG